MSGYFLHPNGLLVFIISILGVQYLIKILFSVLCTLKQYIKIIAYLILNVKYLLL